MKILSTELQEVYEKYPLEKPILMVIQSRQEGLGNNETYFLDHLQSPLFTAPRTNQWFDNNYGEHAGLRHFSSLTGLMALQSPHKSFQSKVFFFLSFLFKCVSSSESDSLYSLHSHECENNNLTEYKNFYV